MARRTSERLTIITHHWWRVEFNAAGQVLACDKTHVIDRRNRRFVFFVSSPKRAGAITKARICFAVAKKDADATKARHDATRAERRAAKSQSKSRKEVLAEVFEAWKLSNTSGQFSQWLAMEMQK